MPKKKNVNEADERKDIKQKRKANNNINNKTKSKAKLKEKKKNKKLIFAILILIVGFALGYLIYINSSEPALALKKYFNYLNDKNYEAIYEIIETDLSKEDFINRMKNIYEGIEASHITATVTANSKNETDESISNVTYTNSMSTIAGNTSFINTAKIKHKDDKYIIIWDSSMIFPDLKNDQKIRVNKLESKRGIIYDRNKNALAKNGEVYAVGIIPEKINDTSSIQKISELLNISKTEIENKIKDNGEKKNQFIFLKSISREQQDLKLQLLNIKGIMINDEDARIYPYKEATSIMTGYVQDREGKSGLELIYNDKLKGTEGIEIYIDKDGTKVKTLIKKDVKNGEDIKLTIDVNLQQKIYNQFKDDKGASVAIDYKTGEILALVSVPSYDANIFSLGISEEEWNNLKNNENNIMFNRYLASYVPGSTIKPIVGAIGLDSNTLKTSEEFERSGEKWQKDKSWEDFFVTTLEEYDEPANLQNALIYSDNIYFAKAALKIGKENLENGFKKFGFGNKIDFEQDVSISTYGKMDSEKSIASTGFGQAELLVNPIHIASIYSCFANEGTMVKPYLIYEENSEKRNKIYKEDVINSKIANIIKTYLIDVVKKGTAKDCYIEGKTIAGKTGTAEIKTSQDDEEGNEIGWFTAFDDNNLLIVSLVEDTKDLNGSHYVVNKTKELFE